MTKKDKINIVTLGCSKNVVDSEYLIKQLNSNQYNVFHDSDSTEAKIVIINTCGFIQDAKQESIDTILGFARAKNKGNIKKLFVVGCLAEIYKEELKKEIPEIDEIFGTNSLKEIVESIGADYKSDLLGE